MLSNLQRQFYSTAGEAGLVDLVGRAQIWLEPLGEAWRARNDENGISRLAGVLIDAITAVDRVDLRPFEVRLRPTTIGPVPVGVICKMTRALVEHLAQGDNSAERTALEALAAAGPSCGSLEFELAFRAALAEFLIEGGDYDLALAAIDQNLALGLNEYSQHLLYRALSKQKQLGVIADSPRIGLDDLSDRFCEQPFVAIATRPPDGDSHGKPTLFACWCPGMLPYPLSRRPEGDSGAEDIWNGPEIQELRRSILDGDYTYCSRMLCARTLNATLEKKDDITDPVLRDIIDNHRTHIETAPRYIMLAHDKSCNIACPSCRIDIITARNEARIVMDEVVDQHILPLLQGANTYMCVSGDGDPFASKHYRRLLQNLDPVRNKGLKLHLQTNGLLFTRTEWKSLSHIHPLIWGVNVSIDAADAETYEDVRRPGKWETLSANMEFLADLRRSGEISFLCICFVVQAKNFEQMPAFVQLGQRWSVDRVLFSRLFPTLSGSSNPADFNANAITDDRHPKHARFLEVLNHPIMGSKEVDLTTIASYRDSPSCGDDAPCSLVAIDEHDLGALVQPPSMSVAVDEAEVVTLAEAPSRKRTFWRSLLRRREKRIGLR